MRQDILNGFIEAARAGEAVLYRELGVGIGRTAGVIPEWVYDYERNQGRPLLTAIEVNKATGMLGSGFCRLAAIPWNLNERRRPVIWARELLKGVNHWQRHQLKVQFKRDVNY